MVSTGARVSAVRYIIPPLIAPTPSAAGSARRRRQWDPAAFAVSGVGTAALAPPGAAGTLRIRMVAVAVALAAAMAAVPQLSASRRWNGLTGPAPISPPAAAAPQGPAEGRQPTAMVETAWWAGSPFHRVRQECCPKHDRTTLLSNSASAEPVQCDLCVARGG